MSTPTDAVTPAVELQCPVCDGTDTDQGLDDCPPICTDCGYLIRPDNDTNPPMYSLDEDSSKTVNVTTWTEHYRIENATQKRLAEAFEQLEEVSADLGIPPHIRQAAAEIYCAAVKNDLTDGRAATVVVAVCILFASRRCERPIPQSRLIACADITRSGFSTCRSELEAELDEDVVPKAGRIVPEPTDYLPFLAKALTLDQRAVADTQRQLRSIAGAPSLIGKDPVGIAAAAVYVTVEDCTQAAVSHAAGVSTETTRKRVTQLRDINTDD